MKKHSNVSSRRPTRSMFMKGKLQNSKSSIRERLMTLYSLKDGKQQETKMNSGRGMTKEPIRRSCSRDGRLLNENVKRR
jgi:hypothetical protein